MNIKKINYNEDYTPGCETCDYGSQYINNLEIILNDNTKIFVTIDNMYDYAFSEADLMELLSTANTIEDFIVSSIHKFIENYRSFYKSLTLSDSDIKQHLSHLTITYNDKIVDSKETFHHNSLIYVGDPTVAWENFINKAKGASPIALRSYAEDYAYDVAEYGSAEFEEAFNKALDYVK